MLTVTVIVTLTKRFNGTFTTRSRLSLVRLHLHESDDNYLDHVNGHARYSHVTLILRQGYGKFTACKFLSRHATLMSRRVTVTLFSLYDGYGNFHAHAHGTVTSRSRSCLNYFENLLA